MKKRGKEETERPTVPRRDEEAGYRRDEKAICTPERERSGVQKSSHSHLYPGEMKKRGYRRDGKAICTPERERSVEADGYGMALLKMEYTWGSNLAIQRIMVCIYITDSCSQETKSN